jgi:predicted small lipoprotein YifL
MSHRHALLIAATAALTLAGCAAQPQLPAPPADLVAAINARGANECNVEVARVLAQHKVTAPMINSVRYTPNFNVNRHGGEMVGQTAWVYLNNVQGVATIQVGNQCSLQSVGTDGGFRFPG